MALEKRGGKGDARGRRTLEKWAFLAFLWMDGNDAVQTKGNKLMKYRVIFALFLSAALCVHAERPPKDGSTDCTDGTCPLPASGEATLSVVSPVPETAVEPMPTAPRLKSLDSKTIALVGESFMANVTHPELKRLILTYDLETENINRYKPETYEKIYHH